MADNVVVTAGTGTTVAADEVVDGTLGTVKVQYVKIMDATLDSTTKAAVGAGGLKVDPTSAVAMNTGARSATTQRVTVATDDLVPITGTLTAVTSLAQMNGQAISMGTGVRAAGTQRVTIATDDLVPITGTLTNLSQMGGVAIALNTGVRSTGTQRVTIATDDLVPVNNTQISGATISTGSGIMGTGTQRVALATDSPGVIPTAAPGTLSAAGPSVTAVNPSNYETVAASATAQALGATGATGDFINGILVVPATTSPGNVLLLDNATSITVFTGGATSVSNLVPFFIPLGMTSVSGAWKVTTGANVSVIGIGKFT
jgi:hypothetical protein